MWHRIFWSLAILIVIYILGLTVLSMFLGQLPEFYS